MDGKIVTVSIIGVGMSGGESYGKYFHSASDKYKLTDICDINPAKLELYGKAFEIDETHRFSSDETFFKEKRSDVLVVSTMEKTHIHLAK